MIISRIRGGLGNQLFQYAAARHLSRLRAVELELDISSYLKQGRTTKGASWRPYLLRRFRITGREVSSGMDYLRRDGLYEASHDLATEGLRPQWVRQDGFSYDSCFNSLPAHVYLDGYWQSANFFLQSQALIRAELIPADSCDVPAEAFRLQAAGDVVAVNVRRGDYLLFPDKHPPVTESYLRAAMAEFGRSYNFLVVSDDIEWCRKVLKGDNIAFSVGRSDIHNFWLMAYCAHNIISNSTFCWWAAWLNANPNKRVIAPRQWFGPAHSHLSCRDLCPQEWLLLDG